MTDDSDESPQPLPQCLRHTGVCLCRPKGHKKRKAALREAATPTVMTLDAVIPRDGDGLTFRYFTSRGNSLLPHLPDELELLRTHLAQEIDDILF